MFVKRVLIIKGGISVEKDISLLSAKNLNKWLNKAKFIVREFEFNGDIAELLQAIDLFVPDVIFNIMHGTGGEDGNIQGILNFYGIPYTGCDLTSSAITMDKSIAKEILSAHGIATYGHLLINDMEDFENRLMDIERLIYQHKKIILKPINQGSSVGVFTADNIDQARISFAEIKDIYDNIIPVCDNRVMIEPYIEGHEIIIAMVVGENDIIAHAGEIITNDLIHSYESKYRIKTSVKLLDWVPKAELDKIIDTSIKAVKILNCKGLIRIDAKMQFNMDTQKATLSIIEINTTPGLTETSSMPKVLEMSGVDMADVVKLCVANVNKPFVAYNQSKKDNLVSMQIV